ncbi:hypothetical protein JG688_00008522 [Phytophthora aleatoria]|uniref:Uncharacterized protein n=1 Tax=Phytophthora aleatoria TaxID=2496075 RepID=A0A8J5MG59_9STRA|nr:hypothetical protein JG688_00008522 [Phytophthora aleatoria]
MLASTIISCRFLRKRHTRKRKHEGGGRSRAGRSAFASHGEPSSWLYGRCRNKKRLGELRLLSLLQLKTALQKELSAFLHLVLYLRAISLMLEWP